MRFQSNCRYHVYGFAYIKIANYVEDCCLLHSFSHLSSYRLNNYVTNQMIIHVCIVDKVLLSYIHNDNTLFNYYWMIIRCVILCQNAKSVVLKY